MTCALRHSGRRRNTLSFAPLTRLAAAGAGVLLTTAACGSAPPYDVIPEAKIVQPQLAGLEVRIVDTPSGPMVSILATAVDRVAEHHSVTVTLTAGASSIEALLSRVVCGSTVSERRLCRQLTAAIDPGPDLESIQDLLASLDAGIIRIYGTHGPVPTRDVANAPDAFGPGSVVAAVEVFSGSPTLVRHRMQDHPAVYYVEESGFGTPAEEGLNDLHDHYLGATVPTLGNDPRPRSASLSLPPGQILSVRYYQPDGSQLESSVVIPAGE